MLFKITNDYRVIYYMELVCYCFYILLKNINSQLENPERNNKMGWYRPSHLNYAYHIIHIHRESTNLLVVYY